MASPRLRVQLGWPRSTQRAQREGEIRGAAAEVGEGAIQDLLAGFQQAIAPDSEAAQVNLDVSAGIQGGFARNSQGQILLDEAGNPLTLTPGATELEVERIGQNAFGIFNPQTGEITPIGAPGGGGGGIAGGGGGAAADPEGFIAQLAAGVNSGAISEQQAGEAIADNFTTSNQPGAIEQFAALREATPGVPQQIPFSPEFAPPTPEVGGFNLASLLGFGGGGAAAGGGGTAPLF